MKVKIERPFNHKRFKQLKVQGNNLLLRLDRYSGAQIHKKNTLYHHLRRIIENLDQHEEHYYEVEDGPLKGRRAYRTLETLETRITEVGKFLSGGK